MSVVGDIVRRCGAPKTAKWSRKLVWAIGILLVLGLLGSLAVERLFPVGPPARFDDPAEQFKYGSFGQLPGFPYELFRVLPEVFQDRLPQPGGWEVFGFIDEGRGYPIGFARQTVGIDSLAINCALCHTATWRSNRTDRSHLVLGAPAGTLDLDAFFAFLLDVVEDPRFTADTLMGAIAGHTNLPAVDRFMYRHVVIPAFKSVLNGPVRSELAWKLDRPQAGCGRPDAFNLLKINILGLKDDGSIGVSDILPLWNQQARAGMSFHWNGSGTNLHSENLISTFSMNVLPVAYLPDAFQRLTNFTWNLAPPKYPFVIDAELVEEGRSIFERHCGRCHDPRGRSTGKIVPQHLTGTDPAFLEMWTDEFRERLDGMSGKPYAFDGLRPSDGFKAVLLDGCWMRAPYLHNGSVPTLVDLLSPPTQRPKHFFRGYDVYDPKRVGFVSEGEEARRVGTSYETSLKGNSNAGHEWGTDLPEQGKRALIEYLKTL